MRGIIQSKKISVDLKREIIKFIDEMSMHKMSKERVCEILRISSRRVRRWKRKFSETGSFEERKKGGAIPRNKLNACEIREIAAMAADEKYSNLSHRELSIRAQDEKRVFASKATFYRVLKALGLIGKQTNRTGEKKKVPAPKIRDVANAPNRVWSWDFTYVWTGMEWIYLLCILDVHSRRLMSWVVTRSMTDDVAIELWNNTLHHYGLFDPAQRPVPLWSFSDHGSQMTSKDTKKFFKGMKIPLVYARYKVPEDNAIHESFHKTLKHDKTMGFYYWKVASVEDLISYMKDFEVFYNSKKTHSGIGDVTPNQKYNGLANAIRKKRNTGWKKAIKTREENNRREQLKKSKKEKKAA